LGVMLLAAAGTITALGDTLFPAGSLAEGLREDFSPAAHFLIQMRVIHPIAAVLIGVYITGLAWAIGRRSYSRAAGLLARALTGLFLVQLVLGALNVALLAPVWMQLVHLLAADGLWILLLLLAASVLGQSAPVAALDRATSGEPLRVR